MILADRLILPDHYEAILWDMDGVLLDTLSFDFELCNRLLQTHWHKDATVSRAAIRENFPYDLPEFWRRLVDLVAARLQESPPADLIDKLVETHERERRDCVCPLNPGVETILDDARQRGMKQAVVSNNPTDEVRQMLSQSGIESRFDEVIGNDLDNVGKKPAPDAYLLAARRLQVDPACCVVVEDSLLGAEAGRRAGCRTVAVATGAGRFEDLSGSPFVDRAYTSFAANHARLSLGNVTQKKIATPNEFVSHMIEHIAWRMGCSVDVAWNNSDWTDLGRLLGHAVGGFEQLNRSAAVLGMIDDGSAEVGITAADRGELVLDSTAQVDLDWFLTLRCEQLADGTPLVDLLKGLAEACSLRIALTVCSLEDPHHTWEGAFRSVGIALSRMYVPRPAKPDLTADAADVEPSSLNTSDTGWTIRGGSVCRAQVVRETAETKVSMAVDCSGFAPARCHFDVSESIHVGGFAELLDDLSRAADFRLEVEFVSKYLSSSHVVMEDVGMVLGRALKEILIARMDQTGINGAGSSVQSVDELERDAIRVGLSVEGRKFLYWVPFVEDHDRLRRDLIIGHTVGDGLFSEDLDDFLDGFVGGLSASLVVHVKSCPPAAEAWRLLYSALGKAIADALAPNPMRKGVPPGVKATLA